jgi:pyruvate dehydrogenase E2 component (dihydrolipoamide acetyltransferase)
MMTLTISADHRAVDGAVAAEFLQTLKSMLEEPGMMLV